MGATSKKVTSSPPPTEDPAWLLFEAIDLIANDPAKSDKEKIDACRVVIKEIQRRCGVLVKP